MTREEFEATLVAKASRDGAFREALISDPKGTIEKELQAVKAGVVLPASLKVSVVQESPDHIYLRLPALAPTMSDQELVATTGGSGGTSTVATANLDVTAVVSGPTAAIFIGEAHALVQSSASAVTAMVAIDVTATNPAVVV